MPERKTSCPEEREERREVLFEQPALEWFDSIVPQVKESTGNKYWNLLKSYALPCFGQRTLKEITHPYIEEQCRYLLTEGGCRKKGLSTKTVSDVLSLVRNILQFAQKKGWEVGCDGRSIQIKKQPKAMRVFTMEEQEQLCKYLCSAPTACNIGILLCLFTGLRLGEICALRWEDVSFSEQTIHVRQTMQRVQDRNGGEKKTRVVLTSPKSLCSQRTIPIPKELMEILENYKGTESGFLLTNSEKVVIEPRNMENQFRRALENSAVERANYHVLRHTFATRCVELGFDVKSLSEILGHSSVNITLNRYVHPSMSLKKENMERLFSLFTFR